MDLLTVNGLYKRYAGKQALDGVNMSLGSGQIIGLLGPNGSGKTTLMKVIAGLLSPDYGEVTYPNGVRRGVASKGVVSFLPDEMRFPSWMKVSDAFGYFKANFPDYDEQKAAGMIKLLELVPDMSIKKTSKGMQERLALALTFSRTASLYLLDEPLGGIDPVGKMKVMQSIITTHVENSSILISTHLVRDVESLLDSVLFLRDGKIVFSGDCEGIRGQGKTVEESYLEVFAGV
ncbi:MAG: ABC transporter ATP-binding protein [Oscillospiraceae bacterium]|nr:ABC transporter ATP-binding protein [Oscillospiraceae bacterium]